MSAVASHLQHVDMLVRFPRMTEKMVEQLDDHVKSITDRNHNKVPFPMLPTIVLPDGLDG